MGKGFRPIRESLRNKRKARNPGLLIPPFRVFRVFRRPDQTPASAPSPGLSPNRALADLRCWVAGRGEAPGGRHEDGVSNRGDLHPSLEGLAGRWRTRESLTAVLSVDLSIGFNRGEVRPADNTLRMGSANGA